MSEPLEAKKAPVCGEGGGNELAPQSSTLAPYRSSEYPGWQPWELRWREIVAAGGTLICSPGQIDGTRLETWARDRQSITRLSTITSIRDRRFPTRETISDWGICGCYAELPRITKHLQRVARILKGQIVFCACPKQREYAVRVIHVLHDERQYRPDIWGMMVNEQPELLEGNR